MLTGKELRRARRAKGINQTDFGRSLGLSRHTISYWENKQAITHRQYRPTVERICKALCLPIYWQSDARARGWGIIEREREAAREKLDEELARLEKYDREQAAKRRVICGAKTRKGQPCRLKSEPGKQRCKFHGGMSTGPKTPEGRERIAEAQRKRWAIHGRQCANS